MTELIFENKRFDPDITGFHKLAISMAQSVGYTADLGIDKHMAQLLRLRVAQLNPCSYCLILHTQAAHDQGISAAKVANLPSWRESTLYSPTERAALAYCEALTTYELAQFPATNDALRQLLDEKQVAEVAAVVINMNVWTRLKLAQGATPVETDGANN